MRHLKEMDETISDTTREIFGLKTSILIHIDQKKGKTRTWWNPEKHLNDLDSHISKLNSDFTRDVGKGGSEFISAVQYTLNGYFTIDELDNLFLPSNDPMARKEVREMNFFTAFIYFWNGDTKEGATDSLVFTPDGIYLSS